MLYQTSRNIIKSKVATSYTHSLARINFLIDKIWRFKAYVRKQKYITESPREVFKNAKARIPSLPSYI